MSQRFRGVRIFSVKKTVLFSNNYKHGVYETASLDEKRGVLRNAIKKTSLNPHFLVVNIPRATSF